MAYIRFINSSTPPIPPTGRTYLYVDSTDNHIKTKDENGVIIDLSETTAYDDTAIQAQVDALEFTFTTITTSKVIEMHDVSLIDASTDLTLTLPDNIPGEVITLKRIGDPLYTVTLIGSIDGTINNTISAGDSYKLMSTDTDWYIL